jgi:hyperosmotically inducible protein
MKEAAMRKTNWVLKLMMSGTLALSPALMHAMTAAPVPDTEQLVRSVRHELVMLPFYGVFDNLSFRVDGNTVTLLGEVTRPTLKSSAARVVERIPGVAKVTNQIEVLPLSSSDDRIRLAVLRAVYCQPVLQRYSMGALPSIHIVVKNGNVSLEGVVSNETDKNLAYLYANGVPGVFSLTNNLRVG